MVWPPLGATISAKYWSFTPEQVIHRNEGSGTSVPGKEKDGWRPQSCYHCFSFSVSEKRPWGLQDVFIGQLQTKFLFLKIKVGIPKMNRASGDTGRASVYLSFMLHFIQEKMLRNIHLTHLGEVGPMLM